MPSILFQTLGCKLNQLETESIAGTVTKAGFNTFDHLTETSPSVIIINTCTVTSKADQKTRRIIRKALRDYPGSFVIVTGCYAQLNYEQIGKLDSCSGSLQVNSGERLFALKGREKDALIKLPELLDQYDNNLGLAIKTLCQGSNESSFNNDLSFFEFSPERFFRRTRGFLKIQDGCNKQCTYCVIRLARGHSISLPAEQALIRLQALEKNYAEVVLTGVNICQYRETETAAGSRGAIDNLGRLLEYLIDGTEKVVLRLSSLAPDSINEDLARVLSHKRIRPSFHLSIQAGSNKILEKMGRNYTGETIERAAALLRSVKDDPFLACDIIAGFPQETELEFMKTFELCQKTDFAWIHVFPYSKRPGTPACSFEGMVQEKEKSRRVQLFTDLAWQGRVDYTKRWLGREVEVLIEKDTALKSCKGVAENYLKLAVQSNEEKTPPPGTVLRCRLPVDQKIDIPKNDYDAIAVQITDNKI